MYTDEFDNFLAESDPVGDLTASEQRLAAAMAEQSAPVRKHRYSRPLAVAAVAALLFGGGGVAAAAATGLWSPWAQSDPLVSVAYQLPSGASCEFRFGNVEGAPDEVDDVIREALAGVELSDREVAEAAATILSGDPSTDDHVYETGVMWAVQYRINAALEAHGLSDQWASIDGEGQCS